MHLYLARRRQEAGTSQELHAARQDAQGTASFRKTKRAERFYKRMPSNAGQRLETPTTTAGLHTPVTVPVQRADGDCVVRHGQHLRQVGSVTRHTQRCVQGAGVCR